MAFCKVGTLDDVWMGEKVGVDVGGRPLLLVNVEGAICAYEDRCRHKGVRLSEGRLDGFVLTCGAHGWQYDARTGRGINPEAVVLPKYAVRIDGQDVLADVPEGAGVETEREDDTRDWVGPVLQKGNVTDAIVEAIRELNAGARFLDRGAYVRVLAHRRCRLTREAVERRTGEAFRLPSDLELVMSSFKGRLDISEEQAVWELVP